MNKWIIDTNQMKKMAAKFPNLSKTEIRVKLASVWRNAVSKDVKNTYLTEYRKLMKIYKSKVEPNKTISTNNHIPKNI